MATVRVRVGKDGRRHWQVRYLGSDGREHAQTFHRKTDADRFVSTIETDKLRGNWVNPKLGKITLQRWYQQFTASRILKPKTAAGYESLMRQHILPPSVTGSSARSSRRMSKPSSPVCSDRGSRPPVSDRPITYSAPR